MGPLVHSADTIIALSSGALPAGVAVVRISGPSAFEGLDGLLKRPMKRCRAMKLARLFGPDGALLDHALVLNFLGPNSFTGEDVVELQCHGGRAVVEAVIKALLQNSSLRLAQPGEFTRRAFEHGKISLSEAEGLADLIDAESESQHRQAVAQMDGALARQCQDWRHSLLNSLALIEADIDFPDEDMPPGLNNAARNSLINIQKGVSAALNQSAGSMRVRDGLKLAILGAPNVGKSSLINYLSRDDVAIVSPIAGTTRDIVEVRMKIGPFLILLADTAGLRDGATDKVDEIEAMGIDRARARAQDADMRLLVFETPAQRTALEALYRPGDVWVESKIDLRPASDGVAIGISTKSGAGLPELESALLTRCAALAGQGDGLFSRLRHQEAARDILTILDRMLDNPDAPVELLAEDVRLCVRQIGRLAGFVDVDEVLDAIFAQFCIGK